jgi:hypothetical protein
VKNAKGIKMNEPGPNQYRCAWCEKIYDLQRDGDWNEEKAANERERDFPGVPMEQCAVVCDDCYQKMRPDMHPKEYEAYKAEKN